MTEPAAELDAELLLDPAVQADPFAYYQQLRAQQPVLHLRPPARHLRPHVPTLHQSDPPEHTRYRRLLNKVFSPGRVRQMIPDVERICDQLIDSFAGRGWCDFVSEFAFPLPGIVISEQLGLAAEGERIFARHRGGAICDRNRPRCRHSGDDFL